MIEITHVVTNGCSWTYGQGLEDPITQAWPALVAKKLGAKVVNLALPGCGNDSIQRRSYEYIFQNLPTGSKPLFIIAWSQFWRKEGWYESFSDRNQKNKKIQDYIPIAHPIGVRDIDEHQSALLTHYSDEEIYRRTLLCKSSLINLFNNFKIPYIMSDYAGSDAHVFSEILKLDQYKKYKPVVDFIHDQYHVESFASVTEKFPKTPCLHDDVDGQIELSSFILKKLQELHGDIKVIPNQNFLGLDQFLIQKHLYWRDWADHHSV
jgi:hypothetical protein